MMPTLNMMTLDGLTAGRLGVFDRPCPICGPTCSAPATQLKKTLRIWRDELAFATFYCARCDAKGYARDRAAAPPDPAKLAAARKKAEAHERDKVAAQLAKARWLWSRRKPIAGSIAETYLREARGYSGPLPSTLAFLPGSDKYPPALIAAIGFADEPEPGLLGIADNTVVGVHMTRLLPDGSGRERGDGAKITIGKNTTGTPIVLAPPNDLLALAISEGIEDALTAHGALGVGAWAAGSAGRLPALAEAVPKYIEAVTIIEDDDAAGRRGARELADRLIARGFEVRIVRPNQCRT